MQVVSMTEARNNFKSIFDSVYYDNDEVIIHRKGHENVVVIPFDQYNAMKQNQNSYQIWEDDELDHIGRIGHNSKSFINDNEDYSKW